MQERIVYGRQQGFTLIELMVVIAIVGILSAIALAQFNISRQKSQASKLTDFARSCALEQVSFCQANLSPTGTTLQNLPSCLQLISGAYRLPSGETVSTGVSVTNACVPIQVVAGSQIGTTQYTSTCRGAYNNSIVCIISP